MNKTLCTLALLSVLCLAVSYKVKADTSAYSDEYSQILTTTTDLVAQYGIRPPYTGQQFNEGDILTQEQADNVLPYIFACESQGRNVSEIDSNHRWSRGVAQYQDITWRERQEQSGIQGKPTQAIPAIQMSLWSLENGYISQWSCSYLEHIIKP